MAKTTWFWRLVCEPECSEACQTNCPGCRALASEWERQGHVLPVTGPRPVRLRWRKFPELWRCWSKSASARMIAHLAPARPARGGGGSAASAQSCGCGPAGALTIKEGVRQHNSAQAEAVLAGPSDGCCTAASPPEVGAVAPYPAEHLANVPARHS
jgi:hypothetical protein